MRQRLRARALDAGLYAIGLAISWTFPGLLKVLALLNFQTVWPTRYPYRR